MCNITAIFNMLKYYILFLPFSAGRIKEVVANQNFLINLIKE